MAFLLEKFKQKHKNNKNKEFPFGEGISKLIQDKKITMRLYPTDAVWAGVTAPSDLPSIEKYIRKDYLGRIPIIFK